MTKQPENIFSAYHAHVYFDQSSLEQASALCSLAAELFNVNIGTIHQKNVGPHPCWSCQISFNRDHFDQLVPWLDNQRQNLNILIHPVTGNNLDDHSKNAAWLGEPIPLNLSLFQKTN